MIRMASLEERIDDLDRRVEALEAARDHRSAADDTQPVIDPIAVDPDTFWALVGLRARTPPPGGVMIVGDVTLPHGGTVSWQEGHGTDDLLDDEWDGAAESLAALGHPTRLALLRHVLRGVGSARELGEIDGMGTSGQVYHHLRQLVAAGWLRSRNSRYEVPADRILPLLALVAGARR